MIGLLGIETVIVPGKILAEMRERLAEVGLQGAEAFALWAGARIDTRTFRVSALVIPGQQAYKTESGVCVTVPGDELHRLNMWLFENGLELIAQVHTHPTDAYHSETDNAFPIVATIGAFSLVLPDFASRPFSWNEVAVYRLNTKGEWAELDQQEINRVFTEV
jgi:hypothetical protein